MLRPLKTYRTLLMAGLTLATMNARAATSEYSNAPSSVHDGSAVAAILRGEINEQVGAKKQRCEPDTMKNGVCRVRSYPCKKDLVSINAIYYEKDFLNVRLCNAENLPAEQALQAIGIELKERVINGDSEGYGMYATNSPYVFVELREWEKPKLVFYNLYAIAPGSDWYQLLPVQNTAYMIEKLESNKTGLSILPLALCPTDPLRDKFIALLQEARRNEPPRMLTPFSLWAIDRQLMLCGHGEEARNQVLQPVEAGRWYAFADAKGKMLTSLPPSIKTSVADTLLKASNYDKARDYLTLLEKSLEILLDKPEELAGYLAKLHQEATTPEQRDVIDSLDQLAQLLPPSPENSEACWQTQYPRVQQAYSQRHYATAFYLAFACAPKKQPLKGTAVMTSALSHEPDIALAQISTALYQQIGLRGAFSREVPYGWDRVTRRFEQFQYYAQPSDVTVPELKISIDLGDQIKSESVAGYTRWVGPSVREQEETRQTLLNTATGEANQLLSRREALLAAIDSAQAAIDNAGVIEYRAEGRTAPSGLVNNTRIWTDRFGIQHTETTTSTQGGQTFGGTSLTLKADTSRSRKLKADAQAELEDVNRRLASLKSTTLTRYDTMQPQEQKREEVAATMRWSGTDKVTVRAEVSVLGYRAGEDFSFDFNDSDGYRDAMTELQMLSYKRADFRIEHALDNVTRDIVGQRVAAWLQSLPPSPSKQLEQELLEAAVVSYPVDFQKLMAVKLKLMGEDKP